MNPGELRISNVGGIQFVISVAKTHDILNIPRFWDPSDDMTTVYVLTSRSLGWMNEHWVGEPVD